MKKYAGFLNIGDTSLGIDWDGNYAHIVQVRKWFRRYRVVNNATFPCKSLEELKSSNSGLIALNKSTFQAAAFPTSRVISIIQTGDDSAITQLGGENIAEDNRFVVLKRPLIDSRCLHVIIHREDLADIPFGELEGCSYLVPRLFCLDTVQSTFPLDRATSFSAGSEENWIAKYEGQQLQGIELEHGSAADEKIIDQFGTNITEIFDLPISDSQLVAFGAALSPFLNDQPAINFALPNQLESSRKRMIRQLAMKATLLTGILTFGIYSLLAVAALGYAKNIKQHQNSSMVLAPQIEQLRQLQTNQAILLDRHKALDSLKTSTTITAELLLQIAESLPEAAWLCKVSLDLESGFCQIRGYARNDETVGNLLQTLSKVQGITRVRLEEIIHKTGLRGRQKTENLHNGNVFFEVRFERV